MRKDYLIQSGQKAVLQVLENIINFPKELLWHLLNQKFAHKHINCFRWVLNFYMRFLVKLHLYERLKFRLFLIPSLFNLLVREFDVCNVPKHLNLQITLCFHFASYSTNSELAFKMEHLLLLKILPNKFLYGYSCSLMKWFWS